MNQAHSSGSKNKYPNAKDKVIQLQKQYEEKLDRYAVDCLIQLNELSTKYSGKLLKAKRKELYRKFNQDCEKLYNEFATAAFLEIFKKETLS